MGYELVYGEEWNGQKIVGRLHLYVSGTPEERKRLINKLEQKIGTTLESLTVEMLDDGTYYKLPAMDMFKRGSPIEQLASIIGVRYLKDYELRELASNYSSDYGRQAHNELAIRWREAGHMVNQWYPPTWK